MRIDREGFLLAAVSLLAGCERADALETQPAAFGAIVAEPQQIEIGVGVVAHEPRVPEAPRRPRSAATRWFFALSTDQRQNVAALCKQREAAPCAGAFASLMDRENPEDKYLVALSVPQRQQASEYCHEQSEMPAPTCETPLVVAFDNQSVEFADATSEPFAFVRGQPMVTDWPTAATPWIARDLDGDGAITNGAELFGSSTALVDGGTARNGFDALVALDANHDGTLDARDPEFGDLVLWSDRNGDHRSTPDELRPLASTVTAIPVSGRHSTTTKSPSVQVIHEA